MTILSVGENLELLKLSSIVGDHAKWYSFFEKQSGSFFIVKHALTKYNTCISTFIVYLLPNLKTQVF